MCLFDFAQTNQNIGMNEGIMFDNNLNPNCGHVISHANDGDVSIENLRPICDKCNNDMYTMDMREFAMLHFNHTI
jgi:5-methylcytosine-specific restriction endonuclease McrA